MLKNYIRRQRTTGFIFAGTRRRRSVYYKEKKIAITIAFSNIIEYVAETLGAEVICTPVGEPYLAQAKLVCSALLGLEEHGSVLLEWSKECPILDRLKQEIPIDYERFSDMDSGFSEGMTEIRARGA